MGKDIIRIKFGRFTFAISRSLPEPITPADWIQRAIQLDNVSEYLLAQADEAFAKAKEVARDHQLVER